MENQLKMVSCDPTCGFMIRSHDTKELKKFVGSHSSNIHHMTVSDKDIESKMVNV